MNTPESLNNKWERYLKYNYFPIFYTGYNIIDYDQFKYQITDILPVCRMIHNFLKGQVYIIKNVLTIAECQRLKRDIHQFGLETPTQNLRADKKIPNYHYKSSGGEVKDGYNEFAHSYYFWRWNPDTLNIFKTIDHFWENVKILNGFEKDGLKKNTPKDRIVDRVQVLHYPLNVGKITEHCDVARWQKTNVAISLSSYGIDYEKGGLYCIDENENKVHIEKYVQEGDAIMWIPTVFHGVEPPTMGSKVDWEKPEGRWQLLAQAVQSWCVKDRVVSVSYENFKKNKGKVLRDYLFNE